MKDKKFRITCKTCGFDAEAETMIASVDFAGTEYGFQYKYVTLRCKKCNAKETIDKTDVI